MGPVAPRAPMKMPVLVIALVCTSVYHSFTLALNLSNNPIIGSTDSTPAVAFNFEGFFLNTLRPAPLNGTITTLEYCYYGRRDNSVRRYQSLVAVYRTETQGTLIRVSDTILITKRLPSDNIPQADVLLQGFNCDYLDLNKNISVIAGDFIGACIYDNSDIEQLNLVSLTDNGDFLPVDSVHHADCETGTLPRRLMNDHLETTTRRVLLHLFAEIIPDDIATDVNDNTTTQPSTYTGQEYLATEELPSAEGQTSTLFITVVVTIGGLVLIAVIILIIVVIIIACCLAQKLKCSDKSAYITASPVQDVSMDGGAGSSSELSIEPSERQYDYIVNDMMLAERFRLERLSQKSVSESVEGNNDCVVQQNVAYTTNNARPKIIKSPYHDDYVVFVP